MNECNARLLCLCSWPILLCSSRQVTGLGLILVSKIAITAATCVILTATQFWPLHGFVTLVCVYEAWGEGGLKSPKGTPPQNSIFLTLPLLISHLCELSHKSTHAPQDIKTGCKYFSLMSCYNLLSCPAMINSKMINNC